MKQRETLFRGLRVDGKGFVEGNYNIMVTSRLKHLIQRILKNQDGSIKQIKQFEVIPETVGQYIGREDREGVKIFEGDYDVNFEVVQFCDKSISYQLATYDHPTKDFIHCNCYSCEGYYNLEDDFQDFLITGNIHTNK